MVAFNGIAPNRIGQMMKRLMRAAVMDSWDWDEGNEELTSGDKILYHKQPKIGTSTKTTNIILTKVK